MIGQAIQSNNSTSCDRFYMISTNGILGTRNFDMASISLRIRSQILSKSVINRVFLRLLYKIETRKIRFSEGKIDLQENVIFQHQFFCEKASVVEKITYRAA